MYLSTSQYYICLHIFPIYFRVFQDLPAPWILQPLNFLFASTIFTISFRVFSRLPVRLQHRPHGFSNLPIFYLPPQFLPFTSVCFQDFPYISDFDPIDLPTSKFPICLNIFTIHSRVFSRVPAYLQCSPRTLRTFTWWLSLVLPGFYVFASLHFDSLFLY